MWAEQRMMMLHGVPDATLPLFQSAYPHTQPRWGVVSCGVCGGEMRKWGVVMAHSSKTHASPCGGRW
ncbi:hypothetical protein CLOP_g14643 [Closterium sp. NIES-67]|nr:hypothetical protein CLOP_g14643 [Closterium sp. NIES-67]